MTIRVLLITWWILLANGRVLLIAWRIRLGTGSVTLTIGRILGGWVSRRGR